MNLVHSNDVCIAGATSFLWWNRIRVSDRFYRLDSDKQLAVLMHEFGHIIHRHTEKRILCLIFTPWRLIEMMKRQEFQADLYAARQGCANSLIEILQGDGGGDSFHPSNSERREALRAQSLSPR